MQDGAPPPADEAVALGWLNASVSTHLQALADLLTQALQRPLHLSFSFNSSEHSEAELIPDDRFDQCQADCLRDCSPFVLQQAGMASKPFVPFLQHLLGGRLHVNETIAFGAAPLLQVMMQLNSTTTALQAGGGSGWGFQLYCDSALLLTAGAGGGGGFSTNAFNRSFAGGGGGGAQVMVNGSWWSAGGGGGCSTHDDEQMACGFQQDNDTQPVDMLTGLMQCAEVSVLGGGGGGGGTGACCSPYRIGYGFAFTLSSHSAAPDDTDGGEVSGMILSAADACGGYDWCCVTQRARRAMHACMAVDQQAVAAIGDCGGILSNLNKLQWILDYDPCTAAADTAIALPAVRWSEGDAFQCLPAHPSTLLLGSGHISGHGPSGRYDSPAFIAIVIVFYSYCLRAAMRSQWCRPRPVASEQEVLLSDQHVQYGAV